MNISIFVTKDAVQFNLEAESDIEKEFTKLLSSHEGIATITTGVDIGFCRGGYIRSFGEVSAGNAVAITIIKKPENPSPVTLHGERINQ